MARTCTVCTHPDRAAIDEALAAKTDAVLGVSRRFGIGRESLRRHLMRHLPGTLVKAQEAREATRADDLLGILRDGVADARRLAARAELEGDLRCAVAAVKTSGDIVEKLAAVAERLGRSPDGTPATLSDLVSKVARSRPPQNLELPVRIEWVNDWRAPSVLNGEAEARCVVGPPAPASPEDPGGPVT